MRKYKYVLQNHLALTECISSIELIGIMDLYLESEVKVKNDDGKIVVKVMSHRSIPMAIEVPSTNKTLLLMITKKNCEGEYEGILPMYREC